MEWTQVLTIVGVNIALFGSISALVVWAISRIEGSVNRMEASIVKVEARLDGHAQRIDQIYGVILSMLKDKNNKEN